MTKMKHENYLSTKVERCAIYQAHKVGELNGCALYVAKGHKVGELLENGCSLWCRERRR